MYTPPNMNDSADFAAFRQDKQRLTIGKDELAAAKADKTKLGKIVSMQTQERYTKKLDRSAAKTIVL